jgi:hypothetical protein
MMSRLRQTGNLLQNANTTPPLSLYDQYGAMAYGVILQIIPHEQLAQEVLVDLFNSLTFHNCGEGVSNAICILRNARIKAIEFSNRFKSLLPANESIINKDDLPKLIFDLAFKQGIPLDVVAEKLGITKDDAMKAIGQQVKSFRKS